MKWMLDALGDGFGAGFFFATYCILIWILLAFLFVTIPLGLYLSISNIRQRISIRKWLGFFLYLVLTVGIPIFYLRNELLFRASLKYKNTDENGKVTTKSADCPTKRCVIDCLGNLFH